MTEARRFPAGDGRPTTAVVLVAGCGSRLGTASGPTKCLTEIGGITLLERQMRALASRVERAVLVVGHERDAVEEAARTLGVGPLAVDFVENPRFQHTGTAESLRLGLSAVNRASDLLIVEGDVLFDGRILDLVMASRAPAATAVDRWRPEFSGTAAVVQDSRVVAWVHESRRPPDFVPGHHYKTVNITLLRRELWPFRLLPALDETLKELGGRSPLEYVFERLAAADPGLVRAVPVDGYNWWEIDTPDDLRMARALLEQSPASI